MQTSPRKITEPLFFAPQNHGDFVLCPAKLWSNADFAPRNRGDIVAGAKKYHQIYLSSLFSNYFCKSLSFPRSLQPFGPLFKVKIFCVTVPISMNCLVLVQRKQWSSKQLDRMEPHLLVIHRDRHRLTETGDGYLKKKSNSPQILDKLRISGNSREKK